MPTTTAPVVADIAKEVVHKAVDAAPVVADKAKEAVQKAKDTLNL